MRSLPSAIVVTLLAAPAPAAFAQAPDPARAPVQALCDGLIGIMKSGRAAGMRGRAAAIAPVVDRSFDLPLMTRLAVGAGWTGLSAGDQGALTTAFRRMTIAQYAANFDGWSGQSFTIDPKVEARAGDRLVRTTLGGGKGAPVALSYRLRAAGGGWKIIDVFYRDSISQLATRRSDFARVLSTGGARALVGHLNDLAAKAGG